MFVGMLMQMSCPLWNHISNQTNSPGNPSWFDWPRQSVPPPGPRGPRSLHIASPVALPGQTGRPLHFLHAKLWAKSNTKPGRLGSWHSFCIHLLGVKSGAVISQHVLKGSKMFRKSKIDVLWNQQTRERDSYTEQFKGWMLGSLPSTLAESNLGGLWASAS